VSKVSKSEQLEAEMSKSGVLETAADFVDAIFEPLKWQLERIGPTYVAIDTETTRIDPKRGFNPFYGPRIAMGSVSWDTDEGPSDFAWCSRMRPGLIAKPRIPTRKSDWQAWVATASEAIPKGERAEWLKTHRAELAAARRAWIESGDVGVFPAWYESLEVEPVQNIDPEFVMGRLRQLTDLGARWIMKNAKFDLLMFWADGFEVPLAQLDDAEIQSHLTEDKPWVKGKRVSHKLQELAQRHLGRQPGPSDAVEEWFARMEIGQERRDYSAVPKSIMGPYAWQDTRDTLDLFHFFDRKMTTMDEGAKAGKSIQELYRSELQLVHNLVYKTIIPGLPVDQEKAEVAYEKHRRIRDEHGKRLFELTGSAIDWSNPHDVAPFLFNSPAEGGLGLAPPPAAFKNKTSRSTDKYVLKAMKHEVCDEILRWRQAHQFCENFLAPIARFNVDGYIHPDFWITTARTGRMSCSHPNMQNRPDDPEIREIFPVRPGYIMLCVDLDQIEMCIAAHYAWLVIQACPEFWLERSFKGKKWWVKSVCYESPMRDGFLNDPDFDPHARAAKATGLPREKEHAGGKTSKEYNFSVLYGSGTKRAAETFGWTLELAKSRLKAWREENPDINHLMNFVTKQLQDRGYLVNEYGRRYYIDADKAYLGLNYLIQGTAADLIKRGVNKLYKIRDEMRDAHAGPTPMFVDNIVHDEGVTQVREDLMSPVLAGRVVTALTTHLRDGKPIFEVPITASCEIAEADWGHTRPYSLEGVDVRPDAGDAGR
jgi:DNA polymerase I-like protein with 3'-5' exonuclease and polymerase domains